MKIKTVVIIMFLVLLYGSFCCNNTVEASEMNDAVEEEQPDTQLPDEKAYIRFQSDTIGANDLTDGSVMEDSWSSYVFEFARKTWNKIWGKQEIYFEIYVRDSESGIEDIGISYNGKEIPTEELKRGDGLKIFTEGGAEVLDTEDTAIGYTVFEGRIACDKHTELEVEDFGIDWILDKAGNMRNERIVLNGAEKLIFLDDAAPVLDVKLELEGEELQWTLEEKLFLNKSPKIKFILDEKNFAKESVAVYPKVSVRKRTDAAKDFEEDSLEYTKAWKYLKEEQWQLELQPAESEEEIEYRFLLEPYQDPSGNVLTGETLKGILKEGGFESGILVIDKISPVLMDYSISLPADCEIQKTPVYKNDAQNDITVKFSIDENPAYYHSENLQVKICKVGENQPLKIIKGYEFTENGDFKLQVEGRTHLYEFAYSPDTEVDGEYFVTIEYADRAGNCMVGKESLKCENGIFQSGKFIFDHTPPLLEITYETDAVNVIKKGIPQDGKTPLPQSVSYYQSDINVRFVIEENYGHLQEEQLQHFAFELWQLAGEERYLLCEEQPKIVKAEGSENKYEAVFSIKADKTAHSTDGRYQFVIKYQDCAGNAMFSHDSNTQELMQDGIYQSPILVLDTIPPEVTTQFTTDVTQVYAERNYFREHTIFQIIINDQNIRCGELLGELKKLQAKDYAGNGVKNSIEEKLYTQYDDNEIVQSWGNETANLSVNIPLTADANYEIPVAFTDLAGNRANIYQKESGQTYQGEYVEKVTVDTTMPKLNLSYSYEDAANYKEEGYLFAKESMMISAAATDDTSGVQQIQFTIVDETGKETILTKEFEPGEKSVCSVSVPLEENDFKGTVSVKTCDYAANQNSLKRNHIVESALKHSKTGTIELITLTEPGRTVNDVAYYHSDVKFRVVMQDTYSGIARWECTGGTTLREKADYKAEAGKDFSKEAASEIVNKLDRTFVIDAEQNDFNDLSVEAGFTDNAGHKLSLEKMYQIDVTKPIIEVTYDLNEPANGRYYQDARTATVKITERNFSAEDVQFLCTSTDGGKPVISEWTKSGTGNHLTHTCTVTFEEDSDYTFSVKFMDLAGNVAEYNRVDEFTIDQTAPVATITYDNNEYLNEYYYAKPRTVTIDILEHNFQPQAIRCEITVDGKVLKKFQNLNWSHSGDHHVASVPFAEDGAYTFTIKGSDLAFNELAEYPTDYFVVDQTAPELEIYDILDRSANNKVVRPAVRCHDIHYEKSSTQIQLQGNRNGLLKPEGEYEETAEGFLWKSEDFSYEKETDDLYSMEVRASDLAGNQSNVRILFSVNRFGSVYTFDTQTEKLIGKNGKYYTNREQPLVITETNVDTLEFKEITMNFNGKLTTLKEGVHYTVESFGTDATWKQYTYKIQADNFKEEGKYTLTIYSEDQAQNISDNNSKGKKIEFVVDKTNPSILISGVENQGKYRAAGKEMTIDLEDNTSLKNVSVTIDGVERVYEASEIYEKSGRLVVNVQAANHWQKLVVTAEDKAGNITKTEDISFLITPNIFVQFYMNKPLFFGSLTLLVLSAFVTWRVTEKKKKNTQG